MQKQSWQATMLRKLRQIRKYPWASFWMQFAGIGFMGRMATWLAGAFSPPYKGRRYLAQLNDRGYFAPTAKIYCPHLSVGQHIFVGDRVTIYEAEEGEVSIGDRVNLHQDCIIQVGENGRVVIGADTHIQPRCYVSAYKGSLTIGSHVQIAANCAFYAHNHGIAVGQLIRRQPVQTKGGIVIGDDVWLGVGVIVLDGVRIGNGVVIGAGAVVTRDVPDNTIAVGMPARVVGSRGETAASPQVEQGKDLLSG
jgi:acetyltransferase-like isoleucine patch superfamily enzyme